ncbi:MAG: nickel-dependent hydrogenase large subunit, partial [Candidatus Aenigmarchaeota archaeon]|nr:nickel-dependent hydrogenase large subunit [Candidatus Aenigmarchaeota archaeon]
MSHRHFTIDTLTKVESHAKLDVEMDRGKIKKTELEVYEAARYFEAMLKGRDYTEAHTITQRICGICTVIHTITSLRAIENALGIEPSQQTIDLRKLMLYASQIHSHTAHLFFFALPDYLGFQDAIEMSKKKHDYVHLALDLQKLASDIVRIIGGRPIHPVTPRIGTFHSFPDRNKIEGIR